MSLKHAFQRVLQSGIQEYEAPTKEEISGVRVYLGSSLGRDGKQEWREILNEWLPRFERVGWTDGLKCIQIGDEIIAGDGAGRYNHNGTIDLEHHPGKFLMGGIATVGSNRKYVLTHEFIHHAHVKRGEFDYGKADIDSGLVQSEVSYYAGTSPNEAVAEIGTGLVHGEQYPDEILDMYEEFGGPPEVHEI